MQDISTRFEILNNKKVQLKNEEGIERAREQISNLSSQEKSLSDRSKQLSDSMNVLLKKDKTLQQQANEIFVKKSKASNAKEIREFTSREKEINQKIKQTQAEYKKLRDESIQISIQIAQVKSSYKKTNQDIQATEKAIRTISEDFFLHMSMAVESFKTGKDNEKCEQYTYLGSILPQVDTTVLDSSLQY